MRTEMQVVRAAGRAHVPVLLWGAPGIGKSALVESVAAADGLVCEVVVGSFREPADFNGLPVVADDGRVRFAPPRWASSLIDADGGVLFLDELTTSTPAVQAAMLRVVNERQVGDVHLPDAVQIIAAANPPGQAADGWDLSAPLAVRFLHLDWPLNPDVWARGMTLGFGRVTEDARAAAVLDTDPRRVAVSRAHVAAFISHAPHRLLEVPDDPARAGRPWPCGRTWTYLADVLAHLPDDATEARLLAACGLVGDGAATEFLTWASHGDLPDPAELLNDPSLLDPILDDATRPDRLHAALSAVIAVVSASGKTPAWEAAWHVLARAAEHGRADVAAASVRALDRVRPQKARIPDGTADAFETVLRDAGLLTDTIPAH